MLHEDPKVKQKHLANLPMPYTSLISTRDCYAPF